MPLHHRQETRTCCPLKIAGCVTLWHPENSQCPVRHPSMPPRPLGKRSGDRGHCAMPSLLATQFARRISPAPRLPPASKATQSTMRRAACRRPLLPCGCRWSVHTLSCLAARYLISQLDSQREDFSETISYASRQVSLFYLRTNVGPGIGIAVLLAEQIVLRY